MNINFSPKNLNRKKEAIDYFSEKGFSKQQSEALLEFYIQIAVNVFSENIEQRIIDNSINTIIQNKIDSVFNKILNKSTYDYLKKLEDTKNEIESRIGQCIKVLNNSELEKVNKIIKQTQKTLEDLSKDATEIKKTLIKQIKFVFDNINNPNNLFSEMENDNEKF